MSGYTEDHLVEQPEIQLMQHELGWDLVNCYGEWDGGASVLGRDGKREVVLVSRLRPALQRLNPDLPVEAIEAGEFYTKRPDLVGFVNGLPLVLKEGTGGGPADRAGSSGGVLPETERGS